MSKILGHDLGSYLREQRESAQLSLRQLADLAGISNPYLSQIERGLRKPSAEILQQIAHGLQVSAESLYVRAGILEDRDTATATGMTVRTAIAADPHLTDRQRNILIDVYESFVTGGDEGPATPPPAAPARPAPKTTTSRRPAGSSTARRKASAPAVPAASALTTRRAHPVRQPDRQDPKEQ